MNIYTNINDLNSSSTFFYKPTENKLACYKSFYKIAYNIENFVLNSILINIDIANVNIIKDNNNYKTIIHIDPLFILKLKNYELTILNTLNKIINKQAVISCQKILSNNVLIYNYSYKPENIKLYIRISGLWESDTQYGLITKIHHYPSTLKF
jgi:hypothetical protein